MDASKKFDSPNPRLRANVISKIFFCWLVPIFWYGRKNEVEPKDIHNVLPKDVSETLGDKLERNWKRELENAKKKKRKPSFLRAIQRTYGLSFMHLGVYAFLLTVVVKMLQPIALGLLIGHFSPSATSSTSDAYIYASGVILMTVLESIIFCHVVYQCRELGMQLRVACSSLIYRKIMSLSCAAASKASGGLVINLLSNDVVRFEQVFTFLHYIWLMPIQGAVVAYLIWRSVGVASLAGVFFMILQTVPFQIYFGKLIHSIRKKVAVRTDGRVLLMNEIINGIRVIKMYTWEPVFQKLVVAARRNELKQIVLANYLKGATWASFSYAQRTALFFCILVYVLRDNVITADKVFTIAQLFSVMQLTMAALFPRGLHFYAEAKVSINRIQNFLLSEEIEATDRKQVKSGDNNANISITKVTASWTKDSITDTLRDVNVTVPWKSLYAVVGPVGAGKSSFLKLILGEFRPSVGRVNVQGRVSYASQEPWLFSGSVRNNILFGQPYDEDKYNKVAKACCLVEDFEQLPHGDRTLVGEKGAALSGGQCARVNLARAVYRDADIYLLDDPLSAVDTRVGKRLFEDCINGYLKNKTRILVTHQIQFLMKADAIVYLENGKIEFQGDFGTFREHDKHFSHMEKNDTTEKQPSEEKETDNDADAPLDLPTSNDEETREEPKETQELVAKGSVSSALYWKYFIAGGSYFILFLYAIIFILAQMLSSGGDYWVAYWTRQEEARLANSIAQERNNGTNETELFTNQTNDQNITLPKYVDASQYFDTEDALYIFANLVFASVIFSTARNIILYMICRNSSYQIHNRMIDCILKAPIRFFDANPSGRILNRFSKDLGAVDEILSLAIMESFQVLSILIGVMVQVLIINWWMIFPMCVMLFFHMNIKNTYLATARSIKRLEGNAKSPVFSHANSSLNGLLTIRSCQAESMVCKEFDSHQDVHTATFSLVLSTSTAFGFWIDLVSVAFIAVVTYSFIMLDNKNISSGSVGLAITQALVITGVLQHGMKMAAEMVTQMIGVERLFQFTKLEQEGPFESEPGKEPPKSWPSKGEVLFEKLYLRYNDAVDPVLKNLNVKVEPGMKVGIVGRTGAGKSSLISALFRLAKVEGGLYIDGVDTKRIGLKDLRSKLSIIPQEPMLFSASLRDNLDPFHEFTDDALWSALQDVELNKAFISLDQSVDQSGSNLSAGQRQLLCLARAIVKRNKVLVLDEATANVDPATDALIQKTIRINFKDCTVLTIAHRLNTIMDSDRVLVMSFGEAVEYDHPHILLQKNNGHFTKMVQQTGNTMAEHLSKIAEKAYKNEMIIPPAENRTIENGVNKKVN